MANKPRYRYDVYQYNKLVVENVDSLEIQSKFGLSRSQFKNILYMYKDIDGLEFERVLDIRQERFSSNLLIQKVKQYMEDNDLDCDEMASELGYNHQHFKALIKKDRLSEGACYRIIKYLMENGHDYSKLMLEDISNS